MDYLMRSLRFAVRIFLRSPSFTLIAVLALALGIGAVTTMFSVINGALLRGLPFENPSELMFVKRWDKDRQPWNTGIPVLDFEDIAREQRSFESLAAWFGGTVNVTIDGTPVRFNGSRISHTWLDILGVQPFMGRGFAEEEDTPGASPVLLLSYAVWKNHYGGSPDVIGQPVIINAKAGTVIGVMPRDFSFPGQEEVWVPLRSSLNYSDLKRGDWSINVMGRLKDGLTEEDATLEMTRLVQQLAETHPDINKEFQLGTAEPISGALLGDQTVRMMWVMMAMGGFVLLIACANVANLLLARSTLRSKELAIRSSLGATRLSIMGQLLVESLALSMAGAIAGTALAWWATSSLQEYGHMMQMPFWLTFDMDWRVLAAVTSVTLLAGLISGIAPAVKASRVSVTDILKDDTRTGSSLRMGLFSRGLVVVQVAISSILLILTVLMTRSVQKINDTDLHFDTTKVFTARIGLFEGAYPGPAERYAFYDSVRRAIEARTEVAHAALYSRYRWGNIGLDWTRLKSDAMAEVPFEELPLTTVEYISPEYFETLDVQLIEGRAFTSLDTPDNLPVVIINESLARTLFPYGNAIGQRFRRELWPPERAALPPEEQELPWLTVVGVAPDMAAQGIGNTTPAADRHYWLPLHPGQAPGFITIAARGPSNVMRLADVVREEVNRLDPNLPLYSVATPAQIIAEDTVGNAIIANIFKIFGMVAVFLASVGIYGIMSFSVNQRIMEFGIRSALGATGRHILVLVMRFGLTQFTFGLVLGLVGAWYFSKLLRNLLFGVSSEDPLNYIVVALVFSAVAITACLMPARRASRVDPARALRYE